MKVSIPALRAIAHPRPLARIAFPVLRASRAAALPLPSRRPAPQFLFALPSRGYATSSSEPSSLDDPAEQRSNELLDLANRTLEDGDVNGAKALYEQSCLVKESPTAWFNLGVCEYHLKNIEGAVSAWEKSLALLPSPDAHTNLASAYIMSKPPQPTLAIKHLTAALDLTPDDPEASDSSASLIAFNLAAILESTDNLDHALALYKRAEAGGVERAAQNIRNISAKLLGRRAAAEGEAESAKPDSSSTAS